MNIFAPLTISPLKKLRRQMLSFTLTGLTTLAVPFAAATPWLDTSDNYVRQSLQTLAQAGLLTGPVNTYPIMWKNIAIDLNRIDVEPLAPELQFAFRHLSAVLSLNKARSSHGVKLSYQSAEMPTQHFGDDYFARTALQLSNEFQGDSFAGKLQLTRRDRFQQPTDSMGIEAPSTIADGSYLAAIWGNWVFAVDQDSVWWGPGQQSSLLLSNNARPIAAVRLSRHSWQADPSRWLNWLGPWNITTFAGQQDELKTFFGANHSEDNRKYWGGRATIRPWPALEFGFSRVVQYGGAGQSNSLSNLWDLISYSDIGPLAADQRAAVDASYHLQAFGLPLTFYAEIADDDNKSGWPDKTLALYGVRSYWGTQQAGHTLALEYSDTLLDCENTLQQGNCAYQSSVFPAGYRRFGRVIGSGLGADAKVLSLGYQLHHLDGISWSGQLSHSQLFAATSGNGLYSDRMWQLKLEHRRPLLRGLVTLQLRLAEKTTVRPGFDQSAEFGGDWEYRF